MRPNSHKEIEVPMKDGIHPKYTEFTANCSCGNVITTRSTLSQDIHLDVCSACHPFYTGKQKSAESGGRVDKFNKRFGALSKK
ncbi:50S ribosomal protein L31 [Colwellia marinimaniae]|uniref:Large ribosomal subunit protein bL31 n=2 Tax=Colwelliaceae TaxID=267889 RepID=A0ABQ0MQF7_9GAMM|nr:50S ribosomal protein L31 [Colwellia marinimaniae]